MIGRAHRVPAGYAGFAQGDAHVVALESLVSPIREAMADGTLYEYGRTHPRARKLMGRDIAYAVPLPDGVTPVVIRHSRHGGMLAPITRDRFLGRTRAPQELATALRLRELGVQTPEIVAYATYPAGVVLKRSDVVTREIVGGKDLAFLLIGSPSAAVKRAAFEATAILVAKLCAAGARHPDLNLKNILLTSQAGGMTAFVLDVDRVSFGRTGAGTITEANLRRLERSARKWIQLYGADITAEDMSFLRARVMDQRAH